MRLGTTPTTNDRLVAVIQDNAASLLRIARAHSLCADDAQDAYQRALEIYLERRDRVDDATVGSWLRTVCKHDPHRRGSADAQSPVETAHGPGTDRATFDDERGRLPPCDFWHIGVLQGATARRAGAV